MMPDKYSRAIANKQNGLDSPDHLGHSVCGQSVLTKLFPSLAELLKMHKGEVYCFTVCLWAGAESLPLSPALSPVSERVRGREKGGERGRIIVTNLFFVDLVGYT